MEEKKTLYLIFSKDEFSIPRDMMTLELYELFGRYKIDFTLSKHFLDFKPADTFTVIRLICETTNYRIEVA